MRSKHDAAVPPLGCADAAMPGAAGVFLTPGLAPSTCYLTADLGAVGSLSAVGLVHHQSLMYQRCVHGNVEQTVGNLQNTCLFTLDILYRQLHLQASFCP
jgi:hypothetical protein